MATEMTDMNLVQKTLSESVRAQATLAKAQRKQQATPEKIDEVAQEFEAMFLSEMMSHMFKDVVDTEGLTGGGHAEEIYRSFLNDEYAKIISRSGGIGVADYVKREMLKLQEV